MIATFLASIDATTIVNVGIWVVGGICTLILVAVRLSWQASKLHSSVGELSVEAVKLREEITFSREDMKIEVRAIHGRIDEHERRIGRIEGAQ